MLRVDLKSARPGMTLALPVMNPRLPGHELLHVGYELTPAVIEKLDELCIRVIWVDYPSLGFLRRFVDQQSIQLRAEVVNQIQDTFESLQHTSAAKLNYESCTKTISGLVDSVEFLETISGLSAAKAYIYGHSHTWNVKQDEAGIHQINLPPTAYVFDKVRPSGWVRATLSEAGVKLELRSLNPDHEQHGETKELAWR